MVHSDVTVLPGPGGKALWSGQFSFEEECEMLVKQEGKQSQKYVEGFENRGE